jgi:uncharacterized protein with HEPN domain
MQPEERVAAHLWDMCEAMRRLARYIDGRTYNDLLESELLEDGVIRQLTVLGEAAGRVPDSFRKLHPGIRWSSIVGLRNVITHQYDRVNLQELWLVATEHAPRLLGQVEAILRDLESGTSNSPEFK